VLVKEANFAMCCLRTFYTTAKAFDYDEQRNTTGNTRASSSSFFVYLSKACNSNLDLNQDHAAIQ
jgi:hypothetical protein